MEYPTNWYSIPGFLSYEMNIRTSEVRSNKHPYKDTHHIMKVRDGRVTIVDDYGKSRRMRVDYLYDITFNSDDDLQARASNSTWLGSMSKVNRNYKSNIDLLNGTVDMPEPDNPKEETAFTGFLNYVTGENDKPKTKPFIINPK